MTKTSPTAGLESDGPHQVVLGVYATPNNKAKGKRQKVEVMSSLLVMKSCGRLTVTFLLLPLLLSDWCG
jgi:hypothetical protein